MTTRNPKMTKHGKRYTPEFKAEAVRLMRTSEKAVSEIAEDLGVSEQTLYRWAKQIRIDQQSDPHGPLTTAEREELNKLRREVRKLRQERDFLKKTAAYFARQKR